MKKLENKVEELIEEKLEEREEDVDREELKQEIIEELADEGDVKPGFELSRRGFLKTLGLGAGGLAFSSLAASANWALWQPQRLGKSEIDADTVDGKEASELSGLSSSDFQRVVSHVDVSGYPDTVTATVTPATKFRGKNFVANVQFSLGFMRKLRH